ncbi:heterokaryon incompatibility protein-domain-containing protein [Lophiotrema nucula]|uniref:Heterokaryon incompatibility protein-domain-containing protein n=1 Tax=Lophiotrema nucula TaxID=690887 RepID=A0A6A5YRY3_9PLEO|nr:heterokaryon incompatibility protein-domain-containing protein [Lophiotrema nucula]
MSNPSVFWGQSNVLSFDASTMDTTIVGHQGDEYPGTALPDNNHIRLVEVCAQRLGSTRTVGLKFHSVRLETAPEFVALSYTWGASSHSNLIQGIHITDNLLSALMNLAEAEPKFWWVDALCINQSDLDEKPEQVKMMRQIYEKANQVCVWLGDPDTVSIELLQKICGRLETQVLTTPGIDYSDAGLERLGLPGFRDPAWGSLMRFLARPYFRRVWVLQELVMARKPVLVACGRLRFTWYLITVATNWLRENHLTSILASQSYQPLQGWRFAPSADLINLTLTLEDRRDSLFLEYLIGASRYLESTDPRDKIIALIGLVSQQDQSITKINIDYRQPVVDFYREVTGTIITTHRSLKLLSLVTDTSSSKIEGLPSWVPDYSIEKDRPSYRYAHFSTPGKPVDVQWYPGSNALHIWGQVADEVQFVADEPASYGNDTKMVLLSWFKAAARFKSADEWAWILSLANSGSAVDRDAEQFWRTMILDGIEGQSPAPHEYREHFASLVFHSFLEEKAGDTDWLIGLGTSLGWVLREELLENRDLECDDTLGVLIQFAVQAYREGHQIKLPDWTIPRNWITLNEESKHTFGPTGDETAFLVQMNSWGSGRFFITKAGRMGKGPLHLQPGDQVAIVNGTEQVFLLQGNAENFRLVGECYVHGLMRSEEKGETTSYQKITLI